jgi:hypothetical protein
MKTNENQKILKKRLRDENNVPYGMVVALNKNQLGYSVCHSKLDKYNDTIGEKIAIGRAKSAKKTNAKYWIKKRAKVLKIKPITDAFEEIIATKKDLKECMKYNIASLSREIAALQELELMQERAKRYFK